MTSPRENILLALFAELQTMPGAKVLRSAILPERIPPVGIMILRDGDPGTPQVTLSPLQYHYEHKAEVELIVQGNDPAVRDAAFDVILTQLSSAITIDRTLGGLCDWVEAEAPKPTDLPINGGEAMKAAVVTIILTYTTSSPLV